MTGPENDARFMRSLLAASDDCIKVLDLEGRLAFMSEGGQRVMEVSDFNSIAGCPWPDFWAGQGNANAKCAIEEARAGRSSRFQGAADTAAGNPRFWDVKVSPILGPDGRPTGILSVSRDITALKEAEEQQRLLALELHHRIKNILTIVQAIAVQTFKGPPDRGDASATFAARLAALGAAQDLLTASAWSSVSLRDLIERTIRPHTSLDRAELEGPDVVINSKSTLTLTLALHELATNAVKYGALSRDAGRIRIEWSCNGEFRFRWSESGGPPVAVPERKGFGSRMIERALASYLLGEASVDYLPSGLTFTLRAPLSSLTDEAVLPAMDV